MQRLFVHHAFDLRRTHNAVSGFVVAAVVAGHFAFPFEFLIAVVGFPDAVVLGFTLRCRNRNHRHVVVFVICQSEPPDFFPQ